MLHAARNEQRNIFDSSKIHEATDKPMLRFHFTTCNTFEFNIVICLANMYNDVRWWWTMLKCGKRKLFVIKHFFVCRHVQQCWTQARATNIVNWTTFTVIQRGGQTRSTNLIQQCWNNLVSRCRIRFATKVNIIEQICIQHCWMMLHPFVRDLKAGTGTGTV